MIPIIFDKTCYKCFKKIPYAKEKVKVISYALALERYITCPYCNENIILGENEWKQ